MSGDTQQPILAPGTLLRDTYTIRDKIASGGMGEVYLAEHVRLPGNYAVKILNARLVREPGPSRASSGRPRSWP